MMTEEQIKEKVLGFIREIAPEADLSNLNPSLRFRDQFDFDSVDFLNFTTKLQKDMNIVIPESDFPKLITLNACIGYLTNIITPAAKEKRF